MKYKKMIFIPVIAVVLVVTGLIFHRHWQVKNFTHNIKIEQVSKQPKKYKAGEVSNDWDKIQDAQEQAIENGLLDNVYATMEIPSINLTLPIFKGTNEFTLSLGAGTFLYDTPVGEGNFVLSGHTTPYQGVLFTNVHQIKSGARVIVKTADKKFEYVVDDIEKENNSFATVNGVPKTLLLQVPKKDEKPKITLITCLAWNNTTGRLLVSGHLV